MVEKWNIGYEIQTMSELKIRRIAIQIKAGPIPSNSLFHHSSIPVPQCIGYVKVGKF
jgi:hypothetical protein